MTDSCLLCPKTRTHMPDKGPPLAATKAHTLDKTQGVAAMAATPADGEPELQGNAKAQPHDEDCLESLETPLCAPPRPLRSHPCRVCAG